MERQSHSETTSNKRTSKTRQDVNANLVTDEPTSGETGVSQSYDTNKETKTKKEKQKQKQEIKSEAKTNKNKIPNTKKNEKQKLQREMPWLAQNDNF